MNIYIASSWKNEHGVTMLTKLLREKGHVVYSWVENSYEEKLYIGSEDLKKWIYSENGSKAFQFDTFGAMNADLLILYSYCGNDAHAEMGVAWAKGVRIVGLSHGRHDYSLMQRMVSKWYSNIDDLIEGVSIHNHFNTSLT